MGVLAAQFCLLLAGGVLLFSGHPRGVVLVGLSSLLAVYFGVRERPARADSAAVGHEPRPAGQTMTITRRARVILVLVLVACGVGALVLVPFEWAHHRVVAVAGIGTALSAGPSATAQVSLIRRLDRDSAESAGRSQ